MIPMSELVKDATYRKFLTTQPSVPIISAQKRKGRKKPWVVYVQREQGGPWGKKEFWKYTKAFQFFKVCLDAGVYDLTINNRRVGFSPPSKWVRVKGKYQINSRGERQQVTKEIVWHPDPALLEGQPDHHWCRYCRRPTVFRYYRKHKALTGIDIDSTTPRCCICGASARIAIDRKTDKGLRVN